jgi:hypothetical protein
MWTGSDPVRSVLNGFAIESIVHVDGPAVVVGRYRHPSAR